MKCRLKAEPVEKTKMYIRRADSRYLTRKETYMMRRLRNVTTVECERVIVKTNVAETKERN